ncbi:type II toxin-antitoxin system antitoxin VapB [Thermodesulfovibrio yellowstonii]|uniref:type II toxin-antitoxin system antitoxin VapB n=1 Tax=Thermodesulfovibrio yellowstonii TaxID=28262 RepID=UPI0004052919|nr:AbrB/MazE/SpoVT family DNA-binding domain-containing protein [Thermodesulfovibrio islandicus]
MKKAKLFKNGQSQAVRLPKEYRLKGNHVFIKKYGNNLILIPAENSWDSLIASLEKFSEDFMSEREQPDIQKREFFDEVHA